jgi:DNA-binding MarR family transcriptional regulator
MARPDATIALLDQFLEVAVLINRDMSVSLGERRLTPARTHLLREVFHRGPCTQRVLADALGVTPRNVTGLVDALEETGFVRRGPHPEDRRATLIRLTDLGTDVMTEMQQGQAEFARILFADMPDRQRAALARGMGHVLDRLRELVPQEEVR